MIETSPGYLKVDYKTFVDPVDYGQLNLAGVLKKSSQVGTTKLALAMIRVHPRPFSACWVW